MKQLRELRTKLAELVVDDLFKRYFDSYLSDKKAIILNICRKIDTVLEPEYTSKKSSLADLLLNDGAFNLRDLSLQFDLSLGLFDIQ